MKHLIQTLGLWVVIFGLGSCVSSQKLTTDPPFTLGEVRMEPWTVGPANVAKGVNIYLPVEAVSSSEVEFDSLYYRGQMVKLEKVQKDSYQVYIGRFMEHTPNNLVLHADPAKEFGNKPTQNTKVTPPIPTTNQEALLQFSKGDKQFYYKLSNMIPATAIHYRELPGSLKY